MAHLDWKHTGRFCAPAFCMDFANGMYITAVPYLAMEFGADSMGLGGLTAVRSCVYVVACLILPLLLARRGRARLIAIAVIGISLSMAGNASSSQLWHLYAIAIGWAVLLSLYWPSVFGWLGDSHSIHQLSRATGAVNVSWSVGMTLGGFAGGWLYQQWPSLPFLAAMVPPIVGCLILLHEADEREQPAETPTAERVPGTRRILISAWTGNTTAAMLFGLVYGVFPKLGKQIGVTPFLFGSLGLMMGLGRTTVFVSGLMGAGWVRRWRVVAATQLVAAAMVATITWAESHLWLAAVFLTVGFSLGVTYFRGLFTSLVGEGARGQKSGAHEAALVVGVLLGSFAGGALAKYQGLRSPYIPAAIVVVVLVAAQAAVLISARRAQAGVRSRWF